MEPEIVTTAPAGNKKKLFLVAVVIILAVVGAALGYLFMQKDTPEQAVPVVAEKKVFTQEEKLKILAELASSTPKDTPAQTAEKLRTLQELAKKTPKDTPEQTAEKLRILQALASSTKQ